LRWIAHNVHEVVAAMVRRQWLRRAERDLQELDDRALKDIGVDRSEIAQLVWHGRRRR
jgi:uncharacterized protein YjiS (DUF1127 family)